MTTFDLKDSVGNIVDKLKADPHEGFPVVESHSAPSVVSGSAGIRREAFAAYRVRVGLTAGVTASDQVGQQGSPGVSSQLISPPRRTISGRLKLLDYFVAPSPARS